MMTIGQLDYALKEKTPIFLRAVVGKKKVELTNYIRGQSCVLSWEVNSIEILEKKKGVVAEILLSESVKRLGDYREIKVAKRLAFSCI